MKVCLYVKDEHKAQFILPANADAMQILREFDVTTLPSQQYLQVSQAELNCCKLFVANLWHQHSLRNSVCRKYEPASYEVICLHCLCSSEHAHNVKNNGFIHYIYFHLLTLKTTKLQSSLFCDGRVRVSQILYQLLFRFNLRMGGALPTPPSPPPLTQLKPRPICFISERARAPRHFLEHFKGTKSMTRGIEAIAFVASLKDLSCKPLLLLFYKISLHWKVTPCSYFTLIKLTTDDPINHV